MEKKQISFNKFYKTFNLISLLLIVISIILLIVKGLNFGVDFKGGTLIELRVNNTNISISDIRKSFSNMNLGDVSVKKFGNEKDFLISDIEMLVLLTLSSISVPPLKSTPKFSPFMINKIIEITINNNEIKLKVL